MHISVLQKEVLQYLNPKPNENFIDATIGEGGHTTAILEKNKPGGKVLGIELDNELYQRLKLRMAEFPISNFQFPNRLVLVNDSYVNLKEIIKRHKFEPVSGILFDLGMSSWHLEKSGRGFSFMRDEPLDMRYDIRQDLTAEEIVNQWPEKEIERILRQYGEERFAKRLARKIVEARPLEDTLQLAEVIRKAKIYSPNRVFQALRIAVNQELSSLEKALPQALEILKPGGRIVIISFHSLEDRIVKNFFKERSSSLKILTKKPITPSQEEIETNPRCRSAKLRAAVKQKTENNEQCSSPKSFVDF